MAEHEKVSVNILVFTVRIEATSMNKKKQMNDDDDDGNRQKHKQVDVNAFD